jgi:hypothetical protein
VSSDISGLLPSYEGKRVRIVSTEGESLLARILHVSGEQEDVVLDILSTDQPDRYVKLGKRPEDSSWAIPFAFIAKIDPVDDQSSPK